MSKIRLATALFVAASLVTSLSTPSGSPQAAETKNPPALKEFVVHLNASGVEKAPAPQDDFYLHVNYEWLKTKKIPATEGEYDAFTALNIKVSDRLTDITRDCTKNRAQFKDTDDEAKIADLRVCIADFPSRNKAGLGDLAAPLARIEKVSSLGEYSLLMGQLAKEYGFGCLLGGFHVEPNPLLADRYVVFLDEPNVGLGKEFLSQPENKEYFQYYRDYMRDLLVFYGRPQKVAEKQARAIFDLQKDLAEHGISKGELYDPSKSTHKLSLEEVTALYPNCDVAAMLREAGIGPDNGITAWYTYDPKLIKRFGELYTPERLQLFKDFAICTMLMEHAGLLTRRYSDRSYEFSRTMSGAPKLKTASKRADELCEELLSVNYGRLYAKKYVSEESRNKIRSYIDLVLEQYRKKLTALDWMSESTKAQAIKKLDSITANIGCPNKWPDYASKGKIVKVENGGVLINNALALKGLEWTYLKDRIGKPVDRTYSDMLPQTVGAFYLRSENSINISAAILQPPFFDPKADRETNLGGIGVVIAHEITHGFDSGGSQYDENGALRNWWTEQDKQEFLKRQAKIVRMYNRYRLQPKIFQNGEQTLTENIADLGGVSCITDVIAPDTEGLRRAYTNYARIWRHLLGDAAVRARLTDVHSFHYVRTDAVLSSTDGFYKAYNVKPGDGMYVKPEDRARIW